MNLTSAAQKRERPMSSVRIFYRIYSFMLGFYTLSLLNPCTVFAGVGAGGGGSYVIIDGRTQISDPYYAGSPVNQIKQITRASYDDLPQEVRTYLDQISNFMKRILLNSDDIEKFFKIHVKAKNRYFLVPKERENNVPCDRYLPNLTRPVEQHFQFGCTLGDDTYLFVDQWKTAPVDEQAFAILHERLWAANPNADQRDIAAFNGWLAKFERRRVQQLLYSDRTPLTADEISSFKPFYDAAEKLGFNLTIQFDELGITTGGGFLIESCRNSVTLQNSFLGLGSFVSNCGHSRHRISNSVILSSRIDFPTDMGEITDSVIFKSYLNESSATRSLIEDSRTYETEIVDSQLIQSDVGPGSLVNCKLNKSEISYVYPPIGLVATDSTFENSKLLGYSTIRFSDISGSDLSSDPGKRFNKSSVLLGESSSRVRITHSNIETDGQTEIGAGVLIEDTHFQASSGNHPKALKIATGASVRALNISDERSFYAGNRLTYEFVIEKGTRIENGTLLVEMPEDCAGPDSQSISNHFYLGEIDHASHIDLIGKRIVLRSQRPSCSTRLKSNQAK